MIFLRIFDPKEEAYPNRVDDELRTKIRQKALKDFEINLLRSVLNCFLTEISE